MQKSINFHKRQKVLNSLIIASFLVLAILVIPLETASGKGLESSNTLEMSSDTEHIPSRTFDETDGANSTSDRLYIPAHCSERKQTYKVFPKKIIFA